MLNAAIEIMIPDPWKTYRLHDERKPQHAFLVMNPWSFLWKCWASNMVFWFFKSVSCQLLSHAFTTLLCFLLHHILRSYSFISLFSVQFPRNKLQHKQPPQIGEVTTPHTPRSPGASPGKIDAQQAAAAFPESLFANMSFLRICRVFRLIRVVRAGT